MKPPRKAIEQIKIIVNVPNAVNVSTEKEKRFTNMKITLDVNCRCSIHVIGKLRI